MTGWSDADIREHDAQGGPSPNRTAYYGILALAMQELGCAAGAIVSYLPSSRGGALPSIEASVGYRLPVTYKLAHSFSEIENRFVELEMGHPVFWEDVVGFRDTVFAREVLIPAGYREGSSATLLDSEGRTIGRMHISFDRAAISPDARPRLGRLSHRALSLLVADAARQKLLAQLTPRELSVLENVVAGKSNSEIARKMLISERTAAAHVASILTKTGFRSRTEAAVHAVRAGIA